MAENVNKEKELEDIKTEETENGAADDAVANDESSAEEVAENVSEDDSNADEEKTENGDEEKTENGDEEKDSDKKKKGFFKKDKKDPRDEKIEELNDRVKRQMAEFENFRKRTEKEKASMYEMGVTAVAEKILPVIDNFERGLSAIPEGADDSFVEGMKMIYKQLLDELDKIGIKPIEALGKEFDPNFHNAVMQVESQEYESGYVAQELQKGYIYHETVVRYSMVAVVQ